MKKLLFLNLCFLLMFGFSSVNTVANDEVKFESTEDFISELKRDKKVVESSNKEVLNSITVDNNDGTNTVYIFNQDIKYIDEAGNIVDKDLSLTPLTDRNKIKDGYILTVKSNDMESSYPISLNIAGIMIEDIEFQAIGSKATLNKEKIDVAEYENAFSGVNLVCKPDYQGFSAKLESDSITALNNVKFDIVGDNIDKIFIEDGKVIVENEKFTYEIAGTEIVNSNNKVVGVSTISLNESNEVVIGYDTTNEITSTESVSTSINVTINNRFYGVTVFEDTTPNNDGYNYIGTKDGYGAARTFIKFNLSALDGIAYDKILSAYYYTGILPESSGIADVFMVTSAWNNTLDSIDYMPNIDYNNKLFSISTSNPNEFTIYKNFYITSAVQAWLQGYENNGLLIKSRNDEGWSQLIAPQNSIATPCLTVKYSTDSDVPISKGVERGEVYYIINRKTKSSIKTLDTIPPSNLVSTDFAMSELEEWHVIYDSTENGVEYFKLRQSTSSSFLEASEPDAQGNSYVSTAAPSNSNGQKWQIVRNWNGSYKIIPKNSNGTKALLVQLSADGSYELILDSITIDCNENDDWTLIPVYKEDATLYGSCISCSNLDSQTEIANITSILTNNGYNCINYHNCDEVSSDNTEEMAYKYLRKLFDSQIWYFSHHGVESKMVFCEPNSDSQESMIGVHNVTEYNTDDNRDVNTYGVSDYEGNLNKLQFAFINSCITGANNGDENLIGTMYEEGAHFVMAHTVSIDSGPWQNWQRLFNIAFQVSDVKAAMTFADRVNENPASLSNWPPKHILGDTAVFYNYEANAVGLEDDDSAYNIINDNNANITDLNELSVIPVTLADTSSVDYNELYYEYDSNGNIYGYSEVLKDTHDLEVKLLYSYYDRYNELGNNYIDSVTSAKVFAQDFIENEMNFNITNNYEVSYTNNTYTNEFVFKCIDPDAGPNKIKSIVVYVEEDSDNNKHVTFCQALYGN